MPRRERRDGQTTIHHVMNRGAARRTIFHDDADRRSFLARIAWEVKRGTLTLYAFALMDNHFHLLVVSRIGELSDAMMRIQNRYVRRFNRRTGRDGPLFRGRFKSIPVEDDDYWTLLIGYIEQNPVEAGIVVRAEDHRFGSAHFRSRAKQPRWLARLPGSANTALEITDSGSDPAWIVKRTLSMTTCDAVRWPDPTRDASLRSWILERSQLAEEQGRIAPAAAPRGVLLVIDEFRIATPIWTFRCDRRMRDAWTVLRAGLLRALCGLGYSEISLLLAVSMATVHNYVQEHRLLMNSESQYAARCAAATIEIVNRIRPRTTLRQPRL